MCFWYLALKIKGFGLVLEERVKGVQLFWPHTVNIYYCNQKSSCTEIFTLYIYLKCVCRVFGTVSYIQM
jgi:hypothetical protein